MEEASSSAKKKHKKHKKHKKSKHRAPVEPDNETLSLGLKIKIKFDGVSVAVSPAKEEKPQKRKKTESADQEEKAWLQALEAGELDERGELKRESSRKLTSRQKAMTVKTEERPEPNTVVPTSVVDPEILAKKQEASRRRKLVAEKKELEAKEATVQKLLQKQHSSRTTKAEEMEAGRHSAISITGPSFKYINNKDFVGVAMVNGAVYPIEIQPAKSYPGEKEKCAAPDCDNDRRYACASNQKPACSLKCYKLLTS
eukprot:m.27774 g.27774  ORF g.27774 m.27774 type:complete len:256 (-) comp7936_c0_seq1:279-1046(-)